MWRGWPKSNSKEEGKRAEKRGRPRKKRFNLFRPIIAEGSGGAEQNGFETGQADQWNVTPGRPNFFSPTPWAAAETGPLPFLRGQYSSLPPFPPHFPGDPFNKPKSSTSPTQSGVVGILGLQGWTGFGYFDCREGEGPELIVTHWSRC